MKTKRIPFDLERAKAGAKVVSRCGNPARLVDCAIKDKNHPILGLVDEGLYEVPETFTNEGRVVGDSVDSEYDLFIEEETVGKVKSAPKTHRMTYKELSWWLREHPEEHREYTHEDIRKSSWNVYSCYDYNTSYADEEVNEYIRIRKNGGEWIEPLIEE